MREHDKPELQPLGAPVKKVEQAKPHTKVNEAGTVRKKPDGTFETLIPANEVAKFPQPKGFGYGWAYRTKS